MAENSFHHLQNRLDDLIRVYERSGRSVITGFLSPGEFQRAQAYLSARVPFETVPSDEEAIYRCLAIPSYDGQLVTLKGTIRANGQKVTQKNVYGALMALNIVKERIGDVWLEEDVCYINIFRSLSDDVIWNLVSLGKAEISLEECDEIVPAKYRYKIRSATVASMRLDSVVKAACGLSREAAQKLIRAGKVRINMEDELHTDADVDAGDIISVSGHGRYRIGPEVRQTKAGHAGIEIWKFD